MDILDIASKLARTTYTKEFCSVCGRAITIDEAKDAAATEAEGGSSQPRAHRDCLLKQTPEKTRTYQSNIP